jgi:GNAT superfamily N-acetyltransferase
VQEEKVISSRTIHIEEEQEVTMEPEFRLAITADIDLLIEFMRQFYAIDQYPFEEDAARTALEQLLCEHSFGHIWLITDEDEAIGYVVVTFGYSLEYHGRDAFVDEIFVIASHRNRGVGTKAMQFVLYQPAFTRTILKRCLAVAACLPRLRSPIAHVIRKLVLDQCPAYLLHKTRDGVVLVVPLILSRSLLWCLPQNNIPVISPLQV